MATTYTKNRQKGAGNSNKIMNGIIAFIGVVFAIIAFLAATGKIHH